MKSKAKPLEYEIKRFLFITVGGAPKPIVESIKEHKPKKILFIASEVSKKDFNTKVDINREFPFLEKHDYSFLTLDDPEDMKKGVKTLKDKAESEHKKWLKHGERYCSVVDITGGTKCMSASLALVARSWEKCVFS